MDACTEHMKHWWKEIEKDETEATHPLKPQQVIARLQDAAAENAVLSVDVGTVTVWMARHFKMKKQDFIVSSWLATMGCGLPGAIAASLAEPERQSIAICGDGGCSYSIMPKFSLFKTTTVIGSLYLTAVGRSCITIENPPSPQMAMDCRSGSARLAAIAPGSPHPIW